MLDFVQCTAMGQNGEYSGLFGKFLARLDELDPNDLFTEIKVVVPNQAMAAWLKDQITLTSSICANIDFVVLLGPVLEKIYLTNNADADLFPIGTIKYLIYEYFCQADLTSADFVELSSYLQIDSGLDKLRAFQLASELEQIFHEYIYLRTDEMLDLDNFISLAKWQKHILQHILAQIKGQTFLDIYAYFNTLSNVQFHQLKLQPQLFIFGLTSVYPSQLKLILKLAEYIDIHWYYLACSNHYYGDLLDSKTRNKLERKLLRKPDLSLDDLYLSDGNPLLANLGQQSREFTELLIAYDIDATIIDSTPGVTKSTFLNILQRDVRELEQRISPDLRMQTVVNCYADPLTLVSLSSDHDSQDAIFDLANQQISIKINSCHNKMREVQVMFNEIADYLAKNPAAKWNDILITAPDIDDYAAYITAVFENEWVTTSVNNDKFKLLVNLTGNRRHANYKILTTLKLILNTPYELPVSCFFELLTQAEIQTNLAISTRDLELISKWLYDNHTHFGYDEVEYSQYGYTNYSVHSFKQFLHNLVLGSCIPGMVNDASNILPLYTDATGHMYTPYDNLDYSQIELCNKLIELIDLLFTARDMLYINQNSYRDLSLQQVHTLLSRIGDSLISDDDSALIYAQFNSFTLTLNQELLINLPIINLIIDEYIKDFKGKINLNGKITAASMQYMRGIPFEFIYVLGMSFGEFPTKSMINRLSLLANEWQLADRNYTIEDKQAFLDIILAAQHQLRFSYIGSRETDNKIKKPSPVLNLFMTTLGQSFTNFCGESDFFKQEFNYHNLLCYQSLHPFYKNKQANYSVLWQQLAKVTDDEIVDQRWDFSIKNQIQLTKWQQLQYYNPDLRMLSNTFLYTNANLYSVLNINRFNDGIVLQDTENMDIYSREIASAMYVELSKYAVGEYSQQQLQQYLVNKGILSYGHIGECQFTLYYQLYAIYRKKLGCQTVLALNAQAKYLSQQIDLVISDTVMVENGNILVMEKFDNINAKELAMNVDEISYGLKIRAMLLCCIIGSEQARFVCNKEVIRIKNVLIRLMNLSGQSRDFIVNLYGEHSLNLNKVLSYYHYSLTNPVLVHKAAIEAYAKTKTTAYDPLVKAENVFYAAYNNFDLDRIRADMIFCDISDNYFEWVKQFKINNDIASIGELLAQLKVTMVSV